MALFSTGLELGLVFILMLVFILNMTQKWLLGAVVPFAGFCFVLALIGFPKSSYHLLLVGFALLSCLNIAWSQFSRKLLRFVLSGIFFVYTPIVAFGADWSFSSKVAAPQLFFFWAGLLIFFDGRISLFFAQFLILVDVFVALLVSARGVFIGAFFSIIFILKKSIQNTNFIFYLFIFSLAAYLFVFPALLAVSKQDILLTSASNAQRSLMNYQALLDIYAKPFWLSEDSIFLSASDYKFDHDTDQLTVHNYFLATALFNGFLPAILLVICVFKILKRLIGCRFFPVAIYIFFALLLGPDGFGTRFLLCILMALSILRPV